MTALEHGSYTPGALLAREDPGDGADALSAIAGCSDRSQELHRLLGPFCHAVRNKLNSLHLCLYMLDAEGEQWSEAIGHFRETMRVVDAIQTICRPITLDLAELPFDLLIEDRLRGWQETLRNRGLSLRLRQPRQPVVSQFDPSRMSSALDDLVNWRSEQAPPGTVIQLQWARQEDLVVLEWVESIGSERFAGDSSSGALPLSVLTRILAGMGGRTWIDLEPAFRLTLRWPSRSTAPFPA